MRRLTVFCGAQKGDDPAYFAAAGQLGTELARRGIGLVYGGGNVGLMGEVARAALEGGAEVIGVIPERLVERELAMDGLSQLVVVRTMLERKQRMAELGDASLALPGGVGTLEELFEALTLTYLGFVDRPVGLLDTLGYYQPLLAVLDAMVEKGFVTTACRALPIVRTDIDAMLTALGSATQHAIYHLVARREWDEARAVGRYHPSSLDREGFIHFSRREQLPGVVDRFFRDRDDVVLLATREASLPGKVRYEPAPDASGERFPHVFGPLDPAVLREAGSLDRAADGSVQLRIDASDAAP